VTIILAYLQSFSCCCLQDLRNSRYPPKIRTYSKQFSVIRSSILVSNESTYATSYYSVIVTLGVSPTVFEILMQLTRK